MKETQTNLENVNFILRHEMFSINLSYRSLKALHIIASEIHHKYPVKMHKLTLSNRWNRRFSATGMFSLTAKKLSVFGAILKSDQRSTWMSWTNTMIDLSDTGDICGTQFHAT